MLYYEEFKAVIVEHISDYLPEEYTTGKIEVQKINKNNQTLDGLIVKQSQEIGITLYLNFLYEDYRNGKKTDEILEEAAAMITQANPKFSIDEIHTPDYIRENVFLCLVNRNSNRELLQTVPYKEYQDLAILYRFRCGPDGTGLITKTLQEHLKIGEEELYTLAVQNTKRFYPPVIEDMNQVAGNMLKENGLPENEIQEMFMEVPEEYRMYIVSNSEKFYGAASILYEDILHELAEKLGNDLYLMPSSLHEMLAVSCYNKDPYELANMVQEINYNEVSLEDQLSNNVYHYDRELRRLSLATDVPEPLQSRRQNTHDIFCEKTVLDTNNRIQYLGRNR